MVNIDHEQLTITEKELNLTFNTINTKYRWNNY